MRYWRNDKAFASWAKLCPGNNQSAGKRRSSWIRAGNQFLRGALVEAAQAAARAKDSNFSALYHRLKAKRGAKRALIAVAHAILVTIYHLLKDGTYYQDLGADHFDRRDREPWSDATSDVSSFSATTSASAPLHDATQRGFFRGNRDYRAQAGQVVGVEAGLPLRLRVRAELEPE